MESVFGQPEAFEYPLGVVADWQEQVAGLEEVVVDMSPGRLDLRCQIVGVEGGHQPARQPSQVSKNRCTLARAPKVGMHNVVLATPPEGAHVVHERQSLTREVFAAQ